MNRRTGGTLIILALGACMHLPAASAQAPSYTISAHYPLGGVGWWDYLAVDSQRHHLFVSRSDRVEIVDTATGKIVSTLQGTDGVHGIAIASSLRRGYTSNGKANSVSEFDLDSLERVRDIPLSGNGPDAILFDPFSQRVFAFNAQSNDVSVIDTESAKEIAKIALPGNPEFGVSNGHGRVYVNIEDKAELVEIDSAKMQVLHTWALSDCEEPSGLAIDVAHDRLFSVCQNRVMAITDAGTGHRVASVVIDEGPDAAEFDSQRGLVFSSNGKSGTLTIVHEDDPEHFRVIQTLITQSSAKTMALDSSTHHLYLSAARFKPQPAELKKHPTIVPNSFNVLAVGDGTAH